MPAIQFLHSIAPKGHYRVFEAISFFDKRLKNERKRSMAPPTSTKRKRATLADDFDQKESERFLTQVEKLRTAFLVNHGQFAPQVERLDKVREVLESEKIVSGVDGVNKLIRHPYRYPDHQLPEEFDEFDEFLDADVDGEWSAMYRAIEDVNMMSLFLEFGAEIHKFDFDCFPNDEVMRLILRHPNQILFNDNCSNHTPKCEKCVDRTGLLLIACEELDLEFISSVLESGIIPSANIKTACEKAIDSIISDGESVYEPKHWEAIIMLLDAGGFAPSRRLTKRKASLLHLAIMDLACMDFATTETMHNNEFPKGIIRRLVQCVNSQDVNGLTPAHDMIIGFGECQKIKIRKPHNEGRFIPLNESLTIEVLEMLLGSGADANAEDIEGDAYLHQVAHCIQGPFGAKICSVLVEKGSANMDKPNEKGQTPLHILCSRPGLSDNLDIVRQLVACGAKLDLPDHDGNTPLHLLGMKYRGYAESAATVLLEMKGGPVCMRRVNKNGNNALIEMACGGADVAERTLDTFELENNAAKPDDVEENHRQHLGGIYLLFRHQFGLEGPRMFRQDLPRNRL